LARHLDGLVDAAPFRRSLDVLTRGLVLFGHLHRRVRYQLPTPGGQLDIVGAGGAALDHPDRSVRAGLNRYDIGADGVVDRIEALVLDSAGGALEPVPIPAQAASP
jgi:hypothetical protein